MNGAWTAERLDDLRDGMKEGFGRVDAELAKVDTRFDKVDADIRELRGEVSALNQTVVRVGGGLVVGMILGFLGVIGGLVGIMFGA